MGHRRYRLVHLLPRADISRTLAHRRQTSMNYGLIHENLRHDIGYIGGVGDTLPDILPSGDWEPYLPAYEPQSVPFETMNCVQFSRLNVCETLANFYKKQLNASDRFLGWASNCTPRGNTFGACDYGLRQHGACEEIFWPFGGKDITEYHRTEPPEIAKDDAKELLAEWDIGMLVWVPPTVEALRAALKKGPVWFCNDKHAMEIYRVDDRIRAFDTYPGSTQIAGERGKGSFPLSYVSEIYAAYLAPFKPKEVTPPPMFDFKENTLYQLVEGKGGFLLYAAGRVYYDDVAKLLASWIVRNGGSGAGKVGVLTLKDLNGVSLFNLKNEPVNL